MSTFEQWLLLLRVHLKMLRVRTMVAAKKSRLMTATIVSFLAAYTIAAYWLFNEGLGYVSKLPAAGSLLSDRLIYVMFFCFLMMLIFSVAVTSYIALYRNRDTRWLLTLPVSHRAIFLWKCFESAMFSSWGLIFILTPLLAAFARIREVSPGFFLKVVAVLIPFLLLASAIGAILLVTAVRFLTRRQFAWAMIFSALFLAGSAVQTALQDRKVSEQTGVSAAMTFQKVLHHTNSSVNRALPSTWLAGSIINWTRPYQHVGNWLYPTLLYSNLFMALLLVTASGKRWFYDSWNRSLQQSASSAIRRGNRATASKEQIRRDFPRASFLSRLAGRPISAITRKDFLTFVREPAQWVQFSLVFGLLAIYASGLRQMNGDLGQPRDLYLVAFLNLSVCALALSTLTTRFVFPQFSLEGRRLWILAMSPLKLPSLVLQKFLSSTLCSGFVIVVILLISGYNLQLGWKDTLFFAGAIGLLTLGLNALAVGYGVVFPNLEESNAAKIVSGFGGTLCLVSSFIYILIFLLLLAYSRWEIFKDGTVDPGWLNEPRSQLAIGLLLILTLAVTLVPLFFSRKKLKRLEILSNL
jgi:ABC-2 type transport system permease protein